VERRRVASERRKRARIAGYKPPSGTLRRKPRDVVEGKEKETASGGTSIAAPPED
jgi:hypothetical protein